MLFHCQYIGSKCQRTIAMLPLKLSQLKLAENAGAMIIIFAVFPASAWSKHHRTYY